jgi:hypothetical protein
MTSAAAQQIEVVYKPLHLWHDESIFESLERLVGNCQLIGYKTPQTISWESKLN